ncbi:MAG: ferredoxin [Opitutus sp.]|nr:ferredoxin [Opitutus sp.]
MSAELRLNGMTSALAPGESLFAAAARAGAPVPSSCRGQGKCRECLVEIASGEQWLTPRSAEEQHLSGSFRLSCCTRLVPSAPAEAAIEAHALRRAALRVEQAAVMLPAAARLERPDPAVRRDGDRILLDGHEIARGRGPLHGLAMDLGTTTVVVRCVDLETGTVVATSAFENPQRFGGTDVMARIQYDTDHPGRLLQRTLRGYLSRAIAELPVPAESIFELVVAGNSTMRDLFFGLDVRSIGQKPYWSSTEQEYREGRRATTAVEATAKSLRLPLHPAARVYGLPLVSAHVGADAAACLLALVPHRSDELVAIMDIGTNTELFLGNRQKLLAASCPAGPAFEGRAIRCGMPGLDGAIAHLALDEHGAVCEREVIGNVAPEGICGSGLVDLLGELRRIGRLNELGRFVDGTEAFLVDVQRGIAFHESDVNELAQAKAANIAGLVIVAKHYGVALDSIDRLYLAGGFGRHLDSAAARRIGLIPDLPDERIITVGNAAIEGATIALLSLSRRRELEQLVRGIGHVQLETDPQFFDHFVSGCYLSPVGPARPEVLS